MLDSSILRCAWTRLIAFWCSVQPPPAYASRCFAIVEGPRDIEFLRRISAILHRDDPAIPDLPSLEANSRLVFLPFGGGDIRPWAFRLASLKVHEVHIYDREVSPLTEIREHVARIVNLRPGCRAFLMQRRAMENYLHADAVFEGCGIRINFSGQDDVPLILAQAIYAKRHSDYSWELLSTHNRKRRQNRAKGMLNTAAVGRMTSQRLAQSDPNNEIRTWLLTIGQLVAGQAPP